MTGHGKRIKRVVLSSEHRMVEVPKLKVTYTAKQRIAMPEGKGTGRSAGSSKRLADLKGGKG